MFSGATPHFGPGLILVCLKTARSASTHRLDVSSKPVFFLMMALHLITLTNGRIADNPGPIQLTHFQ